MGKFYRKRRSSRHLIIAFCLLLILGPLSPVTNLDSPVQAASVIEIHTADDLNDIRNDLTGDYVLMADIDLSAYPNWEPLPIFTGTLDGKNHTITGLTIDRSGESYVGLFKEIKAKGKVMDLTLKNAKVVGEDVVGVLAGSVREAEITNVSVEGEVTGKDDVGGLFGRVYNSSTLDSIKMTAGSVKGKSSIGGLIGRLSLSTITLSFSKSNVEGEFRVGGLIGYSSGPGKVATSYATGDVTGTTAGNMQGEVGGLIGYMNGITVENSYATGSVSGINAGKIGSLIGEINHSGTVENSYATGPVEGWIYTGGLVGRIYAGANSTVSVKNSYAIGAVSASSYTGGLIGHNVNDRGSISESYYDQLTTGQMDSGKGEAKSTTKMIDKSTFSGWNFSSVWGINAGEYPHLQFYPYSIVPPAVNEAPVIHVTNQTISVGETFDELAGVSATDAEDGDLTSEIVVTKNDVDTSTAGVYDVTYEVTDSDGETTTKTITVTVEVAAVPNEAPVINASDQTLQVGDTFDALSGVTASDAEDGDITSDVSITKNNVDTSTAGDYDVTYEVTDSDGETTTKTITVTVEADNTTPPTEREVTQVEVIPGVTVDKGTSKDNVGLPTEVMIELDNGDLLMVDVIWDEGTPKYNQDEAGKYEFFGKLVLPDGINNTDGIKARTFVKIDEETTEPTKPTEPKIPDPSDDKSSKVTIEPEDDESEDGTKNKLPKTATNMYTWMLIGLVLIGIAGALMIFRKKSYR